MNDSTTHCPRCHLPWEKVTKQMGDNDAKSYECACGMTSDKGLFYSFKFPSNSRMHWRLYSNSKSESPFLPDDLCVYSAYQGNESYKSVELPILPFDVSEQRIKDLLVFT